MSGRKVQKVMVQPINLIFRYLQNRTRIQIWLYEDVTHRIEGYIIGRFELLPLNNFFLLNPNPSLFRIVVYVGIRSAFTHSALAFECF
ncbi:hypothetical protein OESDEN_23712 [Oesophagostomum dentatum]|uniref:Uncharacterized protein n=1 Tax=Oesophagostomum dentatum TaxID=61180 RepID=A0A0B1RUC7_OESDE|nr:hypothetical protein OESDEN_23712 [Oesophagostomum dentatum]